MDIFEQGPIETVIMPDGRLHPIFNEVQLAVWQSICAACVFCTLEVADDYIKQVKARISNQPQA